MNLNNVLAKAQRMITSEQFNRDVERAASVQRGGGSAEDFSGMEDALFGYSSGPSVVGYDKVAIPDNVKYNGTDFTGIQMLQEQPVQRDMSNYKLPKSILESFRKTPTPLDDPEISLVEQALLSGTPIKQAPVQQKQPVREQQVQRQAQPQPQYQQPQATAGIDYNYLKYLINECIKENLKGKLNESVGGELRGMKIAPGNKFQFLDSKGNVYEAQLTLIKKKK